MARLIILRYALLGVLDEQGFPLREMGVLESPRSATAAAASAASAPQAAAQALPGMRQRHGHPQGRVRLLHRLRLCGAVRVGRGVGAKTGRLSVMPMLGAQGETVGAVLLKQPG